MSKATNTSPTEELINRAISLLNSGDNEAAREALSSLPPLPRVNYLLSFVEARSGDPAAALKRIENLLSENPNFLLAKALRDELRLITTAEMAVHETNGHIREEMPLEAPIKQEQSSIAHHSNMSVEELVDLSLTHLQENNITEAERVIGLAIERNKPVRDMFYTAAILYLQHENFTKGVDRLRKELEHFPDNDAAQELLSELNKKMEPTK